MPLLWVCWQMEMTPQFSPWITLSCTTRFCQTCRTATMLPQVGTYLSVHFCIYFYNNFGNFCAGNHQPLSKEFVRFHKGYWGSETELLWLFWFHDGSARVAGVPWQVHNRPSEGSVLVIEVCDDFDMGY